MHPFYGSVIQLLRAGDFWWIGLVSMVMYLIFWAIVFVIALKMLKKYFIPLSAKQDQTDNAMQILRERYAEGEIGEEEYYQKKEILEK